MPIGIDENRLKHSLAVARSAHNYALNVFSFSAEEAQEMFVIGLLPDIGYEFVDNQLDHAHAGGEILQRMGMTGCEEVFHHGDPDTDYSSKRLRILDMADLTTTPDGKRCTVKERLGDVISRYGKRSPQSEAMQRLIDRYSSHDEDPTP